MANIKSAKKRIGVNKKKADINKARKSALKTAEKRLNEALKSGDIEVAKVKFSYTEKKLMQAAAHGTIHKKTASRKTSRLAKRMNASTAV